MLEPVNQTLLSSIFFWAQYDSVTNQVYILAGDEDSLFDLGAMLYTVALSTGQVSAVQVDNSKYTLSNFHVDKTGTLYSVSPGLFGASSWTIVTINPKTGAVDPKVPVMSSAKWKFGYGGGVYNGISDDGTLVQTFTWDSTGATALVQLDLVSGKVLYLTDIDLGVNNEKRLVSLVAL